MTSFLAESPALPARHILLATTVTLALTLPMGAQAAPGVFWGHHYERPDLYLEAPPQVRRPRAPVLPKGAAQAEKLVAEGRKPIGPLVIAVSIQRQNIKVYDSNGLFAESPISSGMTGHATPLGVYSVIQKNKHHRSNIYSGAPMPYMQRITWSGIALHAGVLPGYPASHGCIRMPMSFAMKMWSWTRMGARVIVTPGEVSPASFTHPALAALNTNAALAEAASPLPAAVRTADAGTSVRLPKVMADMATGSIGAASGAVSDAAQVASAASADAVSDTPAQVADNGGLPPVPAPAAADFSDLDGGAPAPSLAAQAPEASPVDAPAIRPALGVETTAAVSVQASEPATGTADETAIEPAAAPAPLIKRNLPVAIFVSRKDNRIYVRQNFKPVLDLPIEIAPGDKPLGTHVFTARVGTGEDRSLHWSVVSLPATARQAAQIRESREDRGARPKRQQIAEILPVSTAEEAMARIAIPQDLMARLGEALPAGSSLVVSDQGIAQGETGEGTDFIVRLR